MMTQLQLEHYSPQGYQILAAAQETLSVNFDPGNLGVCDREGDAHLMKVFLVVVQA